MRYYNSTIQTSHRTSTLHNLLTFYNCVCRAKMHCRIVEPARILVGQICGSWRASLMQKGMRRGKSACLHDRILCCAMKCRLAFRHLQRMRRFCRQLNGSKSNRNQCAVLGNQWRLPNEECVAGGGVNCIIMFRELHGKIARSTSPDECTRMD